MRDTVTLGSSPDDEVKVDDFPFLLEYSSTSHFRRTKMDGILGLAPHDESAGPLLVDHLYDQGAIDYPYFAVL